MNVNELRQSIISSMAFAQENSLKTSPSGQALDIADLDRVRLFVAALSGMVAEGDPQLGAALKAFLDAKPGEPLAGPAAPAPASTTPPAQAAA